MDERNSPTCSSGPPFWAMTAPSAGTRSPLSIWDGRTSLFTSKVSSGPSMVT